MATSEPMTPARLAEIAARHKATGTGKWFREVYADGERMPDGSGSIDEWREGNKVLSEEQNDALPVADCDDEDVAVFLVHAHNADIPALLAEVARLNARVAELETPNMFWSEESDSSADSDGEECAIEMADYNLEPHEFPNVINVRCARSLPMQHYRVDMGEDFKITATLVDSDAAKQPTPKGPTT